MPDFSKLRESLKKKKDYFLNDVKDFFIFNIVAILGTLIFYRQTQDEFTATLILSTLWIFFWNESDTLGKIFLIAASIIGYAHELLGVAAGYFTYLGGVFGGVPLWILPGYGVIFWASYHFWKIFEAKYNPAGSTRKLMNWLLSDSWVGVIYLTLVFFALDYMFFGLAKKPVQFIGEFLIVTLLWKSPKEVRIAYFVAFFTVFDEFAGEALGVWSHEVFSLVSLATGYMFLLWMAESIRDIIQRTKVWVPREVVGATAVLLLFAVNTYLRITGSGGF